MQPCRSRREADRRPRRRTSARVTPLLLLLLICTLLPSTGSAAGPSPVRAHDAPTVENTPANPFLQRTWERTDQPVAAGRVSRTWVWGPAAVTGAVSELYADAPGGERLVQYFEKSRMEISDPAHDPDDAWFVTNGLLALELITGRMQLGDNAFEQIGAANVPIAGDPDDTQAATYASFASHLADPPLAADAAITTSIARDGTLTCCVATTQATAGPFVDETGHRVASVFWDYLTSSGPIVERGRATTGALFANPYYATGYPIAEAHWTTVRVAGVAQQVLVQPFERRVLTWTPGNPDGWQVEMGNVGQHYVTWRYGVEPPHSAAPDWDLPALPQWLPDGQQIAIPDLALHYDLHITDVNVDTGLVRTQQTITINAAADGLPDTLMLQVVPAEYGYFTLDALSVNGVPQTPGTRQGGLILAIDLPDHDATALPLTLDLAFTLAVGNFPNDFIGTVLDGSILRLGYWFPIVSDDHIYSVTLDPSQSRVASFDVTLDVAPDIEIAHTGERVSSERLNDGRERLRIHADDVRDIALVLARDFVVTERVSGTGVRMQYFAHPYSTSGVGSSTAQAWADTILDAADWSLLRMSELLGPYPWSTYAIVDVGPNMPGGLEFPGLIYVNPAYGELARLIYHETAHQWMYAIIGNRTLIDGWIDEGAAEFFERGLASGFSEVPSPPDAGYAYWLDSSAAELPYDSSRQWYYSIYEQGARFFHELRTEMGSDAFWRAWQQLYAEYAFGMVVPSEFLAIFQEQSPVDLRPTFASYFRYGWVWELLAPGG